MLDTTLIYYVFFLVSFKVYVECHGLQKSYECILTFHLQVAVNEINDMLMHCWRFLVHQEQLNYALNLLSILNEQNIACSFTLLLLIC